MLALVALLSVSASLHVTVWPDGAKPEHRTWTLKCAPARGTLPRPANACTKLAGMKKPFAPLPSGMACADIFGGPQVALVTGTFRGQKVRARFNRRNGCQTARWNRMRFLFPGSLAP